MRIRTYELSVEEVLLDHDHVDDFRVLERQETESTRAAGNAVSHDRAFCDLAELREVILERLCGSRSQQMLSTVPKEC